MMAWLTDLILTDDPCTDDGFWGVLVLGVTNLASAACTAGVIIGWAVATGVAVIAMCSCFVGVCSVAGDKSGDTWEIYRNIT